MSGIWQLILIIVGFTFLANMGCFGWVILAVIALMCMSSGGSSSSGSSSSNRNGDDDDDDDDYYDDNNDSGGQSQFTPEPDTTYDENEQPYTKWVE